nr:hypothetical protein [Granulibacter bethesdensis]
MSFLSADASERLEAVFARRMDKIGSQIEGMDEDLAIVPNALAVRRVLADDHAAAPGKYARLGPVRFKPISNRRSKLKQSR